jgi:3',5'-cyclic AMP phosphodiesterase CpdA
MNRNITWLHLSDLHARKKSDWDFRQISDSIVRDLKSMQKEQGLRPDFIFFTGDLAFGAVDGESMMDQYQLVRIFLDSIRKSFEPEIPIRDLYLVPGNHDVDRSEILPEQTEWLRNPDRKLLEIQTAMQNEKKQWRAWMERLVNYRNFLKSYGMIHLAPDDSRLIWADARQIADIRLGIVGLNSAWSCANNDDKAKLWLGFDWQIAQAKQLMGKVDFAVVLMHHPSNWFTVHEDPSAIRRLRQEFAIVFHGHEHQEWVEPDSEGRLILSAGACYESSWMANGYSFGQIDLDKGNARIWLQEWDSVGRGWVPRNIAGKVKHGIWNIKNLQWVIDLQNKSEIDFVELIEHNDNAETTSNLSPIEHFTQKFCQHIISQHDVLELFGCDIPYPLKRHQLSVAYVTLNLAQDDGHELLNSDIPKQDLKPSKNHPILGENEEQHKESGNTTGAIEFILDEISLGTGRLLINGPAGSGKSTLMRWCAIQAAKQQLQFKSNSEKTDGDARKQKNISFRNQSRFETEHGAASNWREKIPLLIRLRDCPNGRLPPANELPAFLAKHLPTAPNCPARLDYQCT